jgi:hypothetical protein
MADESTAVATGTNPNQLIPQELSDIRSKHATDGAHEALASASFLPRIQLNQGLSKLVQKKKTSAGAFILVKGADTIIKDYGEQFSCLVLNWRPKAVEFNVASGKGKAYFNPKGKDFQRIEVTGSAKPRPKGFLFGPEYLLYLPDVDQIATIHFSNPTMRNRAGEMKALLGCAATILSEFIESGGNSWYGPNIIGCSTPLPLPDVGSQERNDLNDRFKVAMEKFCQTTEGEDVEEVGEGGTPGTPEAVGATNAPPQ